MKKVPVLVKKHRHWHFDEASFLGYFGLVVIAVAFYTIVMGVL